MIYRKAYISHAALNVTDDDVQKILDVSRRNNAANQLTGLLMFHNDIFFQIIEGPYENLEACYARIKRDTRHKTVQLLAEGPDESRAFDEWQMRYVPLDHLSSESRSHAAQLSGLADRRNKTRARNAEVNAMIDGFLLSFGLRSRASPKAV